MSVDACPICGDAHRCLACVYPHFRIQCETRPEILAEVRRRWVGPTPGDGPTRPTPAEVLALDRRMLACPGRRPCHSCAQTGRATCAAGRGRGGVVYPDDCRSCPGLPADPRAKSASAD